VDVSVRGPDVLPVIVTAAVPVDIRVWMASSAANLDTETSLLEVLDRVLDKGIVMDARLRFSLVGVSLVEIEAPVVIASIETYLACQRTELIDARRAAAPGLTLHRET